MSNSASGVSCPSRKMPSSATSAPGTNASTSTRCPSGSSTARNAGVCNSACSRHHAAASPSSSSARMTPRLAEHRSGLTTTGNCQPAAASSPHARAGSSPAANSAKRGCATPPRASASRISRLLRAVVAAPTELPRSPSRSAARAAMSAVASSVAARWRRTARARPRARSRRPPPPRGGTRSAPTRRTPRAATARPARDNGWCRAPPRRRAAPRRARSRRSDRTSSTTAPEPGGHCHRILMW